MQTTRSRRPLLAFSVATLLGLAGFAATPAEAETFGVGAGGFIGASAAHEAAQAPIQVRRRFGVRRGFRSRRAFGFRRGFARRGFVRRGFARRGFVRRGFVRRGFVRKGFSGRRGFVRGGFVKKF